MSLIENTINRSNIQSLCNYLLYGCEADEPDYGTYEQRLANAYDIFFKDYLTHNYFVDDKEGLLSALNHLLAIHEQVYMEAGFISGVKLMMSLDSSQYRTIERKCSDNESANC